MYRETGLSIVRSNRRYSTCHCPLPGHDDRHASSVIYHDTNMFVCFRCHVRLPLEKLLEQLGLGTFEFERPQDFFPVLFKEPFSLQPLTDEALAYLEERGFSDPTRLPDWVVSPAKNNGVGFLFQNAGRVFGFQVRLFPAFVERETVRYVLEGDRLPWFGDLSVARRDRLPILVFEKAFGTLKAHVAADMFGLNCVALCSAGSNYQRQLLDLVGANARFVFDNDEAGRRAADSVKRQGFRAFIPKNPIDDQPLEKVGEIVQKILEV